MVKTSFLQLKWNGNLENQVNASKKFINLLDPPNNIIYPVWSKYEQLQSQTFLVTEIKASHFSVY